MLIHSWIPYFRSPIKSIALNQTIYPAVVPEIKPKFREVEGFRVQVFAGSDSIQAFSIRDLVSLQTEDSVHYIFEKGLCKIQIGDYLYRYQADNMKTTMRQNGYPGAWVVQRNIIVPIDSSMADSVAIDQPNQQDSAIVAGKYKIQLVATGSLEKAEEIVNNVRTLTNHHVYHEQSGNLFKVLVGSFEEESQARSELEKLRNLGYPDAWLVY